MSKLKELLDRIPWPWPVTLGLLFGVFAVVLLAISSARSSPMSAQYTPVILHQSVMVRGATLEFGEGIYKTAPGALVVPPSMWHVPAPGEVDK